MSLWSALFSTDHGIQSIAVIVFILGMHVWFGFYFKRHIDEYEKNQKNRFFEHIIFGHHAHPTRMKLAEH